MRDSPLGLLGAGSRGSRPYSRYLECYSNSHPRVSKNFANRQTALDSGLSPDYRLRPVSKRRGVFVKTIGRYVARSVKYGIDVLARFARLARPEYVRVSKIGRSA